MRVRDELGDGVQMLGEPVNGAYFDVESVLQTPADGELIGSHAEAIEKLATTYYDLKS